MYTFTHGGYEFSGTRVLRREAPFLAWCLDQGRKHPGRPIKHDGGWAGCAIGDYARAKGHEHDDYNPPLGYLNWNLYTAEHVPDKLQSLLSRAYAIRDTSHHDKLKTYGGLSEIIADWYVVSVVVRRVTPRQGRRQVGEA